VKQTVKKANRKFNVKSETLFDKVQRIIEKEGAQGWNLAKEVLSEQKTSIPQLREAIDYFLQLPDFFRPAFVALCCKAVGGDPKVTIPCGASLILLGKAIGMHDDIIDNTRIKGKRLTAFGKFGKETTLILSAYLMFKGFTLLRKSVEVGVSEQEVAKILETIDAIWFEQSESEFLELASKRKTDVSPKECLIKIEKRASELEAIARIGGILGHGSNNEIDALGRFGRCLGVMSILRNEIVDILEFDVLRHRIKHESLPLPLIYAIHEPKTKPKILQIIYKKRLTITDMKKLAILIDKAEGIKRVADHIVKMAEEAKRHLEHFETKNRELTILVHSHILNQADWKLFLEEETSSSPMFLLLEP